METRKQRKKIICVYCGQLKEVTKDHVIPKCLFIKPYPPNLITVKACEDCNNTKSLNDDYLRDFLVSDNWVSKNPIAQVIFEKMLSSQRQGSSVIARETIKKSKLKPFYTNGGIYLGNFYLTPIDYVRIENIFKMLVCGLFHDARKKRLPDNYVFNLKRIHLWEFNKIWEMFSQYNPTIHKVGEVFDYAFIHPPEDSLSSVWVLRFYGRIIFYVSAMNPNLVGKMKPNG